MPKQKLYPEVLSAAIDGLEAKKARIDAQIAEVRQMLDGNSPQSPATKPRGKRRLSPAGRTAIVEALKRRWAAKKAAQK